MQIAKRVYSLAKEQNDSALLTSANRTLACTSYFLGDFESTRQYAMRALQVWRSGGVQSPARRGRPTRRCLSCAIRPNLSGILVRSPLPDATMAEAIALAKELNNMHGVAEALFFAACLGHYERNPAEVERWASELIELSTRENFAFWLAAGQILRGWARSASGETAEGISWIEDGIEDWRATGSTLMVPYCLALKAEALHIADRTSEALEAITEAETLAERSEERWWCAELYRLRGVFLTAIGADETKIEASFHNAIRIAKEQKSVSLAKRAEATYVEYRQQKASASGELGFRLPLC